MYEIECPFCGKEFDVITWIEGNCPKCNEEYYWDEIITDDYDSWEFIVWENYDKEIIKIVNIRKND